jgi:hypothetical protein
LEGRFDATFNMQQVHRDIVRLEVQYKSISDFKKASDGQRVVWDGGSGEGDGTGPASSAQV